jgi:ATP-dependent Clp protease ATP-binding subunit ClpA
MFERFTQDARRVVSHAQEEARDLHAGRLGTEHLLLGLLGSPDASAARILAGHGLTRATVLDGIAGYLGPGDLDAGALETLGIDLDAVRDRVEATFGPGALDRPACERKGQAPGRHVPFTPRAKKVLELALREAIALKHNYIADGHILLGLLREGQGLALKVLHDRGVDLEKLRRETRDALRSSAA